MLPLALPLLFGLVALHLPPPTTGFTCGLHTPANGAERLLKDLLCVYDKAVIPVKRTGTPININVTMTVTSTNFDEYTNTMNIDSTLTIAWSDEFLRWQPAAYDNISKLIVSSESIWQPELALHNPDVSSIESQLCRPAKCSVKHDGNVQCAPLCSNTARCAADYRRWPFDTQNCSLQHGVWVHDGSHVDFKLHRPNILREASVTQNQEWRLRVATYVYNEGRFGNDSFPNMEYSFSFERHSAVHAILNLPPAIVVVVINLSQMWLSPPCVERLMLVAANVCFHFIYVQNMVWFVPKNGDVVPLILRYFETSLWLTILVLFVAVLSRGLHQAHVAVPAWIGVSVAYLDAMRFGRLFLRQRYLVESQPLHADSIDADDEADNATGADLTDVHINTPEAAGKRTTTAKAEALNAAAWCNVARLIDMVLFVVLVLVYGLMMFEWLPEGYVTGIGDLSKGQVKIVPN